MTITHPIPLGAAFALPACCSVCGSHEIATDEVHERGLLLLSECRRCENRWTEGPFERPRRPLARVTVRRRAVAAEAA